MSRYWRFIILTNNSSRGSPPIAKTTGKVVPRSPYHLPIHPVYPLGKTFLPHLRRETYCRLENHKIWVAIRPLVFKKPRARREMLNLPSPRLTRPAPNESTPPLPSSRLRNPLPILRHLQANWAPLRLRHHLTRPQPSPRHHQAACPDIVVCL